MILAGNPVETNIKSRLWCLTKSDTKIYCFKLHSLLSLLPQIWNQTCSGQGKLNDQTQWYGYYISGCMKSRNLNNNLLDSILCCLNDSLTPVTKFTVCYSAWSFTLLTKWFNWSCDCPTFHAKFKNEFLVCQKLCK